MLIPVLLLVMGIWHRTKKF